MPVDQSGQGSAKLDFGTGEAPSIEELGGAAPQAVNVLIDDSGAVHLRPGISTWADFAKTPLYAASSVDGMAIYRDGLVWVTRDRLLHRLVSSGYATDLSDGVTATTALDGSSRPVFATPKNALVVAGAGFLQKWDGVAALSARLGGSPPPASHVVATNQGLVLNTLGNTGQIQWSSGLDQIESWPALNFTELTFSPDSCVALYENTGELVGMGPESVQMMDATTATIDNAGTLFFTYLSARNFEWGTRSPYSFIQADEKFYMMDDRRRFVMSDGRAFQPISDPALTEVLQNLGTVSDCWGFRLQAGSWNLLVWVFPTDGRAFCYDLGKSIWTEWRGWNNGWAPFAGQSFVTWKTRNLHLMGLADGTIGQVDFTSASDNGQPVVGECITGFQDQGTSNYKQCQAVRLRFKRGVGTGTGVPPKCQLFWRDDLGPFEAPIELDMGNANDVMPTIEIRGLGVYRQRQWKLRMSDTVPLMLAAAQEQYMVSDV